MTNETPSYSVGELVEASVERIVPGGHGLAFAEGLTLFVALAVPGDRVRARIREVRGKIAFAEIEEVLEASPDRIEPPCRYVGACGGCDMQQMTYAAQLDAKTGIIRDCLRRIAKLDHEPDIRVVPSPAEFGYRLRAQWHFATAEGEIGYFRRNSNDLVPIEHCPILVPELDAELRRLRGSTDWTSVWEEKGAIDAACGDGGRLSVHAPALGGPAAVTELRAGGEIFSFSADGFFQGNRFLIDTLISAAIDGAEGGRALDLYSGVGLFTLPLARRFGTVEAVEDSRPAVGYARQNAQKAGLENIEFHEMPVGRYLSGLADGGIDFALLDPPRFGTEKKTVIDLIRVRPRRVSYVSCDPSVLARDLRRFLDGGYAIDSITAIDLFPQTHHVETIVRLSDTNI